MMQPMNRSLSACILFLVLTAIIALPAQGVAPDGLPVSDHFNGNGYFNPGFSQPSVSASGQASGRSRLPWIWRFLFGTDWPVWPEITAASPQAPPANRVSQGSLVVTPVGHATFLIQMDGLNILTDPIWSDRCSPISWLGPKRHRQPGLRFEDLPPIDAVLLSHNHYDHLDLPTLKLLAEKGVPRAIVPLGTGALVRGAGIPSVDEHDWWQASRLSADVTVTLVPAQHFSSRTPWDRDKALWGGFVVSGPSGNVFYSGDTGYGPHFREIARRFAPIRAALLPISPFRPQQSKELPHDHSPSIHIGPAEAVQAHLDIGALVSIAAHFQVFQLGADGFDDAVNELATKLKEHHLHADAFVAPTFGRAIVLNPINEISPVKLSIFP
jgi:L-ascorbate metabolism protein UlaG (beta-lactamase superfamily)